MDEKKPSEVFLALWYSRISGQVISREEFFALAETWAEIRRMETAQATCEVFTPYPVDPEAVLAALRSPFYAAPGSSQGTESTPEGVEKVHPDRVEKVHEDTPEDAVQIGPETEKKLRDNAAAGKASLATRKKNALEKVRWLRLAQNRTMTDIVEADPELSLNVLLDFIDCEPIPLPKLAAIERAVKKLEAET